MPDLKTLDRELREACEKGDHLAVEALVAEGANVHSINWYGRTALMAACQSGDVNTARVLVDAKADVNAQNKVGDCSKAVLRRQKLSYCNVFVNHSTLLLGWMDGADVCLLQQPLGAGGISAEGQR